MNPFSLSRILAALGLALLSSQSAMDLFSTLLAGVVIFLLLRSDQAKWKPTGFETLFILWAAWIGVGYLVNAVPAPYAWKGWLEFRWMLEFIVFSLAWRWADISDRWFRNALVVLVITGSYCSLAYVLGYSPLHQSPQARTENLAHLWRSGGFLNDAMGWSQSAGPLFAFCAGAALAGWKRDSRVCFWWSIGALSMAAAVLFTMTRGVWFASLATFLTLSFLLSRRTGLITGLVAAIALLIVTFAVPSIKDRLLFTLNFRSTHDSERLVLWQANTEIIRDSPLFGWGYGENKRRLGEIYERQGIPATQFRGHAHNQYFDLAAGTGLVGLAFYLFFFGALMRLSWKTFTASSHRSLEYSLKAPRNIAFGVLGALLCFLFSGFTEANFNISKNRMMILFLSSMIFWAHDLSSRSGFKKEI